MKLRFVSKTTSEELCLWSYFYFKILKFLLLLLLLLFKEKSVLEEIDVIVNSLLDILLRTILEITSRPQPSGSALRLQFQDVTVSFLQ